MTAPCTPAASLRYCTGQAEDRRVEAPAKARLYTPSVPMSGDVSTKLPTPSTRLHDADVLIRCARGRVDDEVVERTPLDVGEELPNETVFTRPTPNDSIVLVWE